VSAAYWLGVIFFVFGAFIIQEANKWMLATAGAALLVYSESSARRARSLSFSKTNNITPP
jgi:hypothetical protein